MLYHKVGILLVKSYYITLYHLTIRLRTRNNEILRYGADMKYILHFQNRHISDIQYMPDRKLLSSSRNLGHNGISLEWWILGNVLNHKTKSQSCSDFTFQHYFKSSLVLKAGKWRNIQICDCIQENLISDTVLSDAGQVLAWPWRWCDAVFLLRCPHASWVKWTRRYDGITYVSHTDLISQHI